MKDIHRMRLEVIAQLKNVRKLLDQMEQGVKTRQPECVYPAYVFMHTLAYHLREGDLTPESIELHHELMHWNMRTRQQEN